MKTFLVKASATMTTFCLVASLAAPSAFAATTVKVRKNGAKSNNKVTVKNSNTQSLLQSNMTFTGVMVTNLANTGGNTVKGNTGDGDSTNTTGDVTQETTVTVNGNENTGELACPCPDGDTDVSVAKNGYKSDNTVKINLSNTSVVSQTNVTTTHVGVLSEANTGDNTVKHNTGDGDSENDTGDVDQTTTVTVNGNTNETP